MKRILLTAVLAAAPLAAPQAQSAPSPSAPACTNWTPTSTATLTYLGCLGAFGGNINTQTNWSSWLATATGWSGGTWTSTQSLGYVPNYAGKSDDAMNGPFTSVIGMTSNGGNSGTIGIDFNNGFGVTGQFILGLKAGDSFSFYLFNTTAPITSIAYNTAGSGCNPRCTSTNGLSHAALYATSTTVPEPGSALLVLSGLTALGLTARRRRNQA
jgi:opacity protein-like surface antigen